MSKQFCFTLDLEIFVVKKSLVMVLGNENNKNT